MRALNLITRGCIAIAILLAFFAQATPASASPSLSDMQKNTKTCLTAAKSKKPTTAKQMSACHDSLLFTLFWKCGDGSMLRGVPVKFSGVEKLVGMRVGHAPSVWDSAYTMTDVKTACDGVLR
jgi:hypothetical protein